MTSKVQAYDLSDGSAKWFVRGTEDPEEAIRVVLDEYPEATEDLIPEDADVDYDIVARVERIGWFRFSPCFCGDHGWHLDFSNGPGRGRFRGVYLDLDAVEQHFDCDDDLLTDAALMKETV